VDLKGESCFLLLRPVRVIDCRLHWHSRVPPLVLKDKQMHFYFVSPITRHALSNGCVMLPRSYCRECTRNVTVLYCILACAGCAKDFGWESMSPCVQAWSEWAGGRGVCTAARHDVSRSEPALQLQRDGVSGCAITSGAAEERHESSVGNQPRYDSHCSLIPVFVCTSFSACSIGHSTCVAQKLVLPPASVPVMIISLCYDVIHV